MYDKFVYIRRYFMIFFLKEGGEILCGLQLTHLRSFASFERLDEMLDGRLNVN